MMDAALGQRDINGVDTDAMLEEAGQGLPTIKHIIEIPPRSSRHRVRLVKEYSATLRFQRSDTCRYRIQRSTTRHLRGRQRGEVDVPRKEHRLRQLLQAVHNCRQHRGLYWSWGIHQQNRRVGVLGSNLSPPSRRHGCQTTQGQ
eukprot:Lithocolla_globosa_v1_NODE_311_length_4552_cov_62.123416.p3 type:complete len:144 gc:universal NODE_311_length_4552_cov_62.123416:3248-3679(+)